MPEAFLLSPAPRCPAGAGPRPVPAGQIREGFKPATCSHPVAGDQRHRGNVGRGSGEMFPACAQPTPVTIPVRTGIRTFQERHRFQVPRSFKRPLAILSFCTNHVRGGCAARHMASSARVTCGTVDGWPGAHVFIYLFIYLLIYLFIHLFIYSFIYLFIYLLIYLFIYLFIYLLTY